MNIDIYESGFQVWMHRPRRLSLFLKVWIWTGSNAYVKECILNQSNVCCQSVNISLIKTSEFNYDTNRKAFSEKNYITQGLQSYMFNFTLLLVEFLFLFHAN